MSTTILALHHKPLLDLFLRPAEAADLAGLSTGAIYRAMQRGALGSRAPVLAPSDPS